MLKVKCATLLLSTCRCSVLISFCKATETTGEYTTKSHLHECHSNGSNTSLSVTRKNSTKLRLVRIWCTKWNKHNILACVHDGLLLLCMFNMTNMIGSLWNYFAFKWIQLAVSLWQMASVKSQLQSVHHCPVTVINYQITVLTNWGTREARP